MASALTRDLKLGVSEGRLGKAVAERQQTFGLPDLTEVWKRLPPVPGDSGRFLEEDRER